LEAARRSQPDAVICDIGLPGMDGFGFARELRRKGMKTFLIALSGYGQEEDKRQAREAGFDLHVTKPVDPETLERALRTIPHSAQSTELEKVT
jgi:CheY-like chemotaxis protein